MNKIYLIISTIVLSAALIISSYIFGKFLYDSRQPLRTLNTVGIASKQYDTDTIKWSITLEERSGIKNIKDLYSKLNDGYKKLEKALKANGINEKITVTPMNMYPNYNRDGVISGYVANQKFYIISKDIDKVESLALFPDKLTESGILIKNSKLGYYYSKVDDMKKEILAKATINARERGDEIISNTDYKVGDIINARTGVFQITEPYSTAIASYGLYNTSSRRQEIKVTVHVTFELDKMKK